MDEIHVNQAIEGSLTPHPAHGENLPSKSLEIPGIVQRRGSPTVAAKATKRGYGRTAVWPNPPGSKGNASWE